MTFRIWNKFALVLSVIPTGGVQAFVIPKASGFIRPMTTLASAPAKVGTATAATEQGEENSQTVLMTRMAELDMLLEQADGAIGEIDETMALATDDDYLCIDLQKKKERIEKQMNKYYNELDSLEAKLEGMGYSFDAEDEFPDQM